MVNKTYTILAHGGAYPSTDGKPVTIDESVLKKDGRQVINFHTVLEEGLILVGPDLGPTATMGAQGAKMRETACLLIEQPLAGPGDKLHYQGSLINEYMLIKDNLLQFLEDSERGPKVVEDYTSRFHSGVYECTADINEGEFPIIDFESQTATIDPVAGRDHYYTFVLSDVLQSIKDYHYVTKGYTEDINVIGIFCLGGICKPVDQISAKMEGLGVGGKKKKSKRCPDGTRRSKNTGKCVKKRTTKRPRRRGRSKRPAPRRNQSRRKKRGNSNGSKKPKKPKKGSKRR